MKKINELFGIDLRALAVFRICLGLIVLYDVGTRLPDVNAFYSDAGLLPRASLIEQFRLPEQFCLHLMSGAGAVQMLLLIIQALCGLGLALGFRSRWVIVFCWILIVSLNNRNIMVNGAGDDYFRHRQVNWPKSALSHPPGC